MLSSTLYFFADRSMFSVVGLPGTLKYLYLVIVNLTLKY